MVVSESVEDYLEAILVLQEKNGYVRSVDIANHLELAKSVYEKHLMFSEFFIELGVPKEIAARDACKIEHVVSKTTFDAIKSFVAKHSEELKSKNV